MSTNTSIWAITRIIIDIGYRALVSAINTSVWNEVHVRHFLQLQSQNGFRACVLNNSRAILLVSDVHVPRPECHLQRRIGFHVGVYFRWFTRRWLNQRQAASRTLAFVLLNIKSGNPESTFSEPHSQLMTEPFPISCSSSDFTAPLVHFKSIPPSLCFVTYIILRNLYYLLTANLSLFDQRPNPLWSNGVAFRQWRALKCWNC